MGHELGRCEMSIGRRAFCLGLGSAAAWCAGRRCFAQEADGAAVFLPADMDPAGGYTVKPPAQFLFTDFRHIDPGDLNWLSPEGAALPVAGPPDPPVPAVASLGLVARGIRLVAQRAGKEGLSMAFQAGFCMTAAYTVPGRFRPTIRREAIWVPTRTRLRSPSRFNTASPTMATHGADARCAVCPFRG